MRTFSEALHYEQLPKEITEGIDVMVDFLTSLKNKEFNEEDVSEASWQVLNQLGLVKGITIYAEDSRGRKDFKLMQLRPLESSATFRLQEG